MHRIFNFFRWFSIIGIILWISLGVVKLLQALNPDSHFDLGWFVEFLDLFVFALLITFFILCFKSYSKMRENHFPNKIYYPLIIIGLFNLIVPIYIFYELLKDILDPPKSNIYELLLPNLLESTEYTKQLSKATDYITCGIGLITLILFLFSFKIKRSISKNSS